MGGAVNLLLAAERLSPQLVRYDQATHDVLTELLRREHRPSTPELRPLARRAGVIAVFTCWQGAHMARRRPASDRGVPLPTAVNGALMAQPDLTAVAPSPTGGARTS